MSKEKCVDSSLLEGVGMLFVGAGWVLVAWVLVGLGYCGSGHLSAWVLVDLGSCGSGYLSTWVLVGLGSLCNELCEYMLSVMLLIGRIVHKSSKLE